jgi:ribosomal protein S18 acetylase RimI-like enzyme
MAALPNSFVFAQVPSTAAEDAFEFHRNIARKDIHIHPRIESEIDDFAQSGHLFGVRRKNTNEFVGLCYVVQDSAESDWQLGGLTVTVQKQGIGELLVRFALAHTIVYGVLLQEGNWAQKILAYVRNDNSAPRRLLRSLGFEHSGTDVISYEDAPAWMERNRERGNIVFDEFAFTLDGLRQLATWFDERFDGTLHPSGAEAQIDLVGHNRIEHLTKALRHLAGELGS